MTYFNGDFGLSLRYPAGWKTEQGQDKGFWYRQFVGPPAGADHRPSVSVTLLAGPFAGSLDDHAKVYLAGKTPGPWQDEARGGAKGRSYEFASADGATQYTLLLLAEGDRLFGLHAQAQSTLWPELRGTVQQVAASLTLERPAAYPEVREDAFGFALRMPPSWREMRRFSGGGTLMLQYASPQLAVDKGSQTVQASLTVTVERIAPDDDLDAYYDATRLKLGDAFKIVSHKPWQAGYVDVMTTETGISASRVKRFYAVGRARGYSLTFEAREDVFARVARWCDLIAETFRLAGS